MKRGNLLSMLFLAGLLLVTGCTPSAEAPPLEIPASEPQTHTVAIQGSRFVPAQIFIKAGDTVEWFNDCCSIVHTAVSDDELFDSGDLDLDDRFRFTFEVPGSLSYHCRYHADMNGVVIVE